MNGTGCCPKPLVPLSSEATWRLCSSGCFSHPDFDKRSKEEKAKSGHRLVQFCFGEHLSRLMSPSKRFWKKKSLHRNRFAPSVLSKNTPETREMRLKKMPLEREEAVLQKPEKKGYGIPPSRCAAPAVALRFSRKSMAMPWPDVNADEVCAMFKH